MSNKLAADGIIAANPRIALIHALEESVLPARSAIEAIWPAVRAFDLMDTSLAVDLARKGRLDQSIMDRFLALSNYAHLAGGQSDPLQGILFTCSAFGPAIDAVKAVSSIPVLRPNEAAFRVASRIGQRIGLMVTFLPSLDGLSRELQQIASEEGRSVEVIGAFADGALEALKSGDTDAHDRIVSEVASKLANIDALVLGQFSLARALDRTKLAVDCPVVTTPAAAVRELRRLIPSERRTQ